MAATSFFQIIARQLPQLLEQQEVHPEDLLKVVRVNQDYIPIPIGLRLLSSDQKIVNIDKNFVKLLPSLVKLSKDLVDTVPVELPSKLLSQLEPFLFALKDSSCYPEAMENVFTDALMAGKSGGIVVKHRRLIDYTKNYKVFVTLTILEIYQMYESFHKWIYIKEAIPNANAIKEIFCHAIASAMIAQKLTFCCFSQPTLFPPITEELTADILKHYFFLSLGKQYYPLYDSAGVFPQMLNGRTCWLYENVGGMIYPNSNIQEPYLTDLIGLNEHFLQQIVSGRYKGSYIRSIDFSKQLLTDIKEHDLDALGKYSIVKISFANNWLHYIHPQAFKSLHSIEVIDLEGNPDLKGIPTTFINLKTLKKVLVTDGAYLFEKGKYLGFDAKLKPPKEVPVANGTHRFENGRYLGFERKAPASGTEK